MPDFFDRLIARGTRQPGGGTPAPGPGSGAPVAFALPRLPGPFERLAAEPLDPFLEAVDEVREVDSSRPDAPRARPALGSLTGTQAAIAPLPLLPDSTTSRIPRSATTGPGEQPPARPAPVHQAPLLHTATPVHLVAEAAAALDQGSARPSGPTADRGQEPDVPSRLEHPIAQPPSVTPRMLVVPANAVRAARPAADDAPATQAPPPAPPPVIVRIGRIEVRNTSPDRRERQPKRGAGRAAPKQTLAAYLAAASGGRNGSGISTGGGR